MKKNPLKGWFDLEITLKFYPKIKLKVISFPPGNYITLASKLFDIILLLGVGDSFAMGQPVGSIIVGSGFPNWFRY